jgi:hypothetical protein
MTQALDPAEVRLQGGNRELRGIGYRRGKRKTVGSFAFV